MIDLLMQYIFSCIQWETRVIHSQRDWINFKLFSSIPLSEEQRWLQHLRELFYVSFSDILDHYHHHHQHQSSLIPKDFNTNTK